MINLKPFIPLASIGVITISFLNMYFYFNAFGIQIQNYLEVSEVLFSLTTFISSFIFVGLLFVFYWIVKDKKQKVVEQDSTVPEENKLSSYLKSHRNSMFRFFSQFARPAGIVLLSLIAGLILFIWFLSESFPDSELLIDSSQYDFCLLLFFLYLSILLLYFKLWRSRAIYIEAADQYFAGFLIIFSIILFIGVRSQKRADLVIKGHPKYWLRLETRNSRRYESSDSLLYVGTTQNFYFFFHSKSKVAYVIPFTDITETRIKRLRGGL